METTDKQTDNSKQNNWQEKIADKVMSDKQLLDSLKKLLTNPVVLIIAVLVFGYWFNKTQAGKNNTSEAATLELEKMKKKYKKLKRKYRDQGSGMNGSSKRTINFD
jgi:hypothetical protein